MSLASTTNKVDFTGNGAVDTYSYTFKIIANTDLRVLVRDESDPNAGDTVLTLTTHYTVTGVGEAAGGTVALVNGNFAWLDADGDLKSGYHLTIRRVRPLTQATDIRNQGTFFPEVHEDSFDHGIMVAQQQQADIDRSLRLLETVTGVSVTLPTPVASQYLRWNSAATALENAAVVSSTSLGTVTINSGDARGVVSVNDTEDGFLIYTITEWLDLLIGSTQGTQIVRGASAWQAQAMPATETIVAAATITANANGTIKRISAASAITTNTTNTFTAPAAANAGFIMLVINVGSFNITLDRNANFKTDGGEDLVLKPGDACYVASTGAGGFWYQATPRSVNS